MTPAAVRNVKTMILPLPVRAVATAALWINATTSSTPGLPRALTAGIGAGVTFLYTAVEFSISGTTGLAAAGIGTVIAGEPAA